MEVYISTDGYEVIAKFDGHEEKIDLSNTAPLAYLLERIKRQRLEKLRLDYEGDFNELRKISRNEINELEGLLSLTKEPREQILIEEFIRKIRKIDKVFFRFLISGSEPKEVTTRTFWKNFAKEVTGQLFKIKNLSSISELNFGFINPTPDDVNFVYGYFMNLLSIQLLNDHPIFSPKNQYRKGPILLEGETGTGKTHLVELFNQEKKYNNTVSVNLASITESVFESRLKGHVKGAFTGADSDAKGWFESSHGGSLFLDELQSTSIESQVALLDLLNAVTNRVSVAKLGKDSIKSTYESQLIAAINEPIELLLKSGKLRKDLYHRFRSIYKLKSLKELFNDIQTGDQNLLKNLILFRWKCSRTYIKDQTKFYSALQFELTQDVLDVLKNYNWPGNFREFEKLAFDIFLDLDLKRDMKLSLKHLPNFLLKNLDKTELISTSKLPSSNQTIKIIEMILKENNFKVSQCSKDRRARDLKISSYTSLRRCIVKNYELFSDDIKNQQSIKNIMKKFEYS